jgi:hypothetical protein
VWQYFEVVVPADTNLLGWDLRLTNVVAGNLQMYVSRDLLPPASGGVGASWTVWPSGYGTTGGLDWTGCGGGPMLEVGMGNPLQPGTYYIGVQDPYYTNSYSLESRGIGLGQYSAILPGKLIYAYSIPVTPLNLTGSVTDPALPVGEADYYQVVVASNTPDWKLDLALTNGEALLMVQQDFLPSSFPGGGYGQVVAGNGGQKMMKPGDQQWALLPPDSNNGTNVVAGTYYVLVASQGQNPVNNCEGTNTAAYTLTSWVDPGNNLVGTLGLHSDSAFTNSQPGGSLEFYQFTVPPNLPSLQVTLENTVGNPWMTLNTGTFLVSPTSDEVQDYGEYGNYGGTNEQWNSYDLITIPNPQPGVYSLSVYAAEGASYNIYPDASYTVAASVPPLPPLSFCPELDGPGVTNVVSATLADTASAFYEVTVTNVVNGAPVLGWYLGLSATNGTPTLRVRPNLLPAATEDTTTFAAGSSVIAPPYLTPGTWYVEVIARGLTSFTLTSSAITTNTTARSPWGMPAIGQTTTAPGLNLPVFGDTGVDPNGAPLPGADLAQGQYAFYAIVVPTNNAGLLRTELQALSGTPNLYLRAGAAPTFNHYSDGSGGSTLIDRQLTAATTEYGNWVPLNGQTATNLTPGLWVLSVFAAGNANASYRLQLACGDATTGGLVQALPLDGSVTYNDQQLAGGDWRYYLVPIPTNAPNNWVVTWTVSQGAPCLFVRDTVPPGDGAQNYDDYNDPYSQPVTWLTDDKDQGPYPEFTSPGSDALTTPPVRPASVYYLGFWSQADATFSVTCATNGGGINVTNIIPLSNGVIGGLLAGNSSVRYRIDVPANATNIAFTADNNAAGVVYSLEQGTVALPGGPAHWVGSGTSISLNQPFTGVWPWLTGCSYYLTVTNNSAVSELFSLTNNVRLANPPPPAPPGILGLSVTGTNLVITGTNGMAGGTYWVLASTDLTRPPAQWTPVATNVLASGGGFTLTVTNAVSGAYPQRFFILQLQ